MIIERQISLALDINTSGKRDLRKDVESLRVEISRLR